MANVTRVIKKCINCGCENDFDLFVDTEEYGLPDLDSRPSMPRRGEIDFLIQRCPNCNYASIDIEKEKDFDKEILNSDEYINLMNSNYPYVARSYMLAALIDESIKNYKEAGLNMLRACWVLDDNNLDSEEEREKAANLLVQADLDEKEKAMVVDIYRRASFYDEAKELISNINSSDELINSLLEIEKKLMEACDNECHNCSEFAESASDEPDTIEEIEAKIFGDTESQLTMLYDGLPLKFDVIATLEVQIDNQGRWFTILHSELQQDNEAFVYELEINGEGRLQGLDICSDEEIINQVFDEYYKLVE